MERLQRLAVGEEQGRPLWRLVGLRTRLDTVTLFGQQSVPSVARARPSRPCPQDGQVVVSPLDVTAGGLVRPTRPSPLAAAGTVLLGATLTPSVLRQVPIASLAQLDVLLVALPVAVRVAVVLRLTFAAMEARPRRDSLVSGPTGVAGIANTDGLPRRRVRPLALARLRERPLVP